MISQVYLDPKLRSEETRQLSPAEKRQGNSQLEQKTPVKQMVKQKL